MQVIESKLKEIAEHENGEYTIHAEKNSMSDGSFDTETVHNVRFEYHGSAIDILIQVGYMDSSRVVTTLSSFIRPIDFTIHSISPFKNLFLRRKSRFNVKCQDEIFKNFLENKALSTFDTIMKTDNFDPEIFSQTINADNRIVFEFHLAFRGWSEVYGDIVTFLKLVIDELKEDNRYFSTLK